jgi:hypothetical protein
MLPGADSATVGSPPACYRLIPKKGRGRQSALRVPEDVVLLDVRSDTRLEVVRLVALEDSQSGAECTGIVVRRDGDGVMLVAPYPVHDVVLGCEIEDVLGELLVWTP